MSQSNGFTLKIIDKHDVWWCRVLAWFAGLAGNKTWMDDYTLTIGNTIYAPDPDDVPEDMIRHESIHVTQQLRWPRALRWLWFVCYALFPVPIFFAWFRWRMEREAYLGDIESGRDIEEAVQTLWRDYFWPWPRRWMRRWFKKRAGA